jgi:hypothetical protein
MDAPSPPDPTDNPHPFRDTSCQLAHHLDVAASPAAADSPDVTALRDRAAIEHLAALQPADAEQANLATQYIAASSQALHCLRLAHQHAANPVWFQKLTALAASMMRQARQWRAALLYAQQSRSKRQLDTATPSEPVAVAASEAQAAGSPHDPVAEAERYALQHHKRAALIRRLGRLPDKFPVPWLRPEVVHAIATGTTPILRALEQKAGRAGACAA